MPSIRNDAMLLAGYVGVISKRGDNGMPDQVAGIKVPDSVMCKQATKLVQAVESELLLHHSLRVFHFAALVGRSKDLQFDSELLYIAAMFHDLGLTTKYRSQQERFEVDGAFVAAHFLREYKIKEEEIEMVWNAIALHTTPGIPQHMKPVVALLTAGVEMDVLGLGFSDVSNESRAQIAAAYPREQDFKQSIIKAFYDGIKEKPQTTFGNVKADVLEKCDPNFKRINFCEMILHSGWST
jgi:hypothetical protein